MTPSTPVSRARGKSRRGARISPLTNDAVCQPPYANSTGTIAAASAVIGIRSPLGDGATAPALRDADPVTTRATTATIFVTINTLCTLLPARTPRQLIAVSASSVVTASVGIVRLVPFSSRK